MVRDWGSALALAVLPAAMVVALQVGAGAAASTPVTVTIKDAAACGSTSATKHCFTPYTQDAPEGHYVAWTSQSTASHQIEMDDGSGWMSGVIQPAQQNAYPHLFSPGDHKYHCHIHPSMLGVIYVSATSTTSSDSTSSTETSSDTTTYTFSLSSTGGGPTPNPTPTPAPTDGASPSPTDGDIVAQGGADTPSTGYTTTEAGRQLTAVADSKGRGDGGGHGLLIAFLVMLLLGAGSAGALWWTRPNRV